ncbi:MAG TPA: anti-sigma factor [Thermoanaerobaculia bacterium]|jgi:anti-sigma factor RsiW
MSRPDHSTYREWLTLDADGGLGRDERSRLEAHLAACPECRQLRDEVRDEILALDGLLRSAAVEPRPDFRETIMSALPTAGWESRSPRAWRFTAAVILLLGVAAGLLVAGSSVAPSGFGALFAVGGMLRATLVAGAGLAGASWKGMGLILDRLIASPVSLGAFGFLVLALNLFLFSLIRRKRPVAQMDGRDPRPPRS